MKRTRQFVLSCVFFLSPASLLGAQEISSDKAFQLDPSIKRSPVQVSGATGYLYQPVQPGAKSHLGIFVMHFAADYTSFSACTELSKRGYTVLCMKNSGGDLNHVLLDARSSIEYLHSYAGIDRVVLWGHSGGATLMTAYQMIAENGVAVCQGQEKLAKCPEQLGGGPAADGIILADSNWGNAEMALLSIDPAVLHNDDGMNINPALNLFDPKNGFNSKGNSDYSREFIQSFQHAVAVRNNSLIQLAESRLAAIEAGKGHFADDEPFVAAGAGSIGLNNKLFVQDTKLMAHTKKSWPLIHADGSVTVEMVYSLRRPSGSKSFTPLLNIGAINTTVRSYLVDSAIRVGNDFGYGADDVHGVDWTSSYSSTPGNVESIRVPTLVMGMTGGYEYLAAETIYANSATKDKSLAFVEGATHIYTPCRACEKTPGEFGDTIKNLYDYADRWLAQPGRFFPEMKG
jgi:hypothetical protein